MNLKGGMWLLCFLSIVLLPNCTSEEYVPKPRGYLRFEYPEHVYSKSELDCPFSFEYPEYSHIALRKDQVEPCWFNLQFPVFRAKIHFSYKPIDNNLNNLVEDSRSFVYKHTIKASNIDRTDFQGKNENVFVTYYKIDGNAASSVQFTITDSSQNFLRGALYFESQPNEDSLGPALTHLEEDIKYMISSFQWK